MLEKRIIPILLLHNEKLLKGKNFINHTYVGDPINTVHLFNEKEVNELIILDIGKRKGKKEIQYELLKKISSEAFFPLTYGGGIDNLDDALKIIDIGFEKIVLNSAILNNLQLLKNISKTIGSQSAVVSIDVRFIKNDYYVFTHNGLINSNILLRDYLDSIQNFGAGEVMITSIDKEGSRQGYDLELIKLSLENLKLPLIINGGAKSFEDFKYIFKNFDVAACAASSVFMFIGKFNAVLISYPSKDDLKSLL